MESQPNNLKVIFLPFLAPGHIKPMVDTARLFAKLGGASVTIITTQATASTFQKAINSDFTSGYSITTHVLQFPATQVGLPDGAENIKAGTSPEILGKIALGLSMLEDQIEHLFQELQPDCLVTDMFYFKTTESAAKLGIPRLCYVSSSYYSGCAIHFIKEHKPHEKLVSDSDTEKFLIPGLPHNIEMTTLQLEDYLKNKTNIEDHLRVINAIAESERSSYGTLCNSFHELESDYEKLYQSIKGVKSWSLGPISAWVNRHEAEKEELLEEPEWLNWLNSKPNESVLYVSFGSITRLPHAQLVEIAHGLEDSGHNFIWVVRNMDGDENGETFMQGFEQKVKESNKGYIIWNWAPQLLILNHPSIGGVVTHCGWNSALESVTSGLPVITWPMFAEQFHNEKLLTDVAKVAVSVGAKENKFWTSIDENAEVTRDEIVKAVKLLMGNGEESKEMRKRARMLGDAAKRAIEEGGSSYNNLMQLINELKSLKLSRASSKSKLDN